MDVKVCDFRSLDFDGDFVDSVINTGFAVIINHGIPSELIRKSQEDWRTFFLMDNRKKSVFANEDDPNMGYKSLFTEKAVGAKTADLKEFYHWKPGQELPTSPFEISGETQMLFYRLQDLGMMMLKVLDNNYGPDSFFRDSCLDSDNTILRTLYYPALDFEMEAGAVRAAAHEDINFITLLVAASAPGLEVQDLRGNWHSVPHKENSVIVNVGDMLQLATNGHYKSTTHRVVNPEDTSSDRISMPLFIHPHSETILAPGITAKQFLNERIAEIYGNK